MFFSQLELYYGFNTAQFLTDQEKLLFAASYLEGPVFTWFNIYLRDYLDNQADPKKQEEEQEGQREAVEHHKCLEKQRDREVPEGPPRHTAPQSP